MTLAAAERFIRDELKLSPPPELASIRLYTAHPGSGLRRLTGASAPYWAYPWPGGIALARYFGENRSAVAGKRVLDFGCGGGLAGIAAAQAGAAAVFAADTDPIARVAARLNAEANGIAIEVLPANLEGPPAGVDLIAAGDLFYSRAVSRRALSFLRSCNAAGIAVLIGDPARKQLPRALLTELARYATVDFGNVPTTAFVFALGRKQQGSAGARIPT